MLDVTKCAVVFTDRRAPPPTLPLGAGVVGGGSDSDCNSNSDARTATERLALIGAPVPAELAMRLRPFQAEGVRFLWQACSHLNSCSH